MISKSRRFNARASGQPPARTGCDCPINFTSSSIFLLFIYFRIGSDHGAGHIVSTVTFPTNRFVHTYLFDNNDNRAGSLREAVIIIGHYPIQHVNSSIEKPAGCAQQHSFYYDLLFVSYFLGKNTNISFILSNAALEVSNSRNGSWLFSRRLASSKHYATMSPRIFSFRYFFSAEATTAFSTSRI